jgi:hypothetical protein
VDEDFSEANNLAEKNPEKLKELQDLFTKEAVKKFCVADTLWTCHAALLVGLFPSLTSQRNVQERPATTLLVNYGDNRN